MSFYRVLIQRFWNLAVEKCENFSESNQLLATRCPNHALFECLKLESEINSVHTVWALPILQCCNSSDVSFFLIRYYFQSVTFLHFVYCNIVLPPIINTLYTKYNFRLRFISQNIRTLLYIQVNLISLTNYKRTIVNHSKCIM